MNKIFYISLYCVMTVALLSGCRKLDEVPYSSIFMDQFYKTAADAEAAINGVYNDMAGLYAGPSALLVPDFSADQVYPRPVVGRNTLTLFIFDPEYSVQSSFDRVAESPLNIWQRSYAGIEKANWVLDKVPAIVMTESRRNEILGEAFFLRAFFHWMLAKNFGEIPVKITPSRSVEDAIVGKSSKAEIYRQIYADLDSAIINLNTYTPAGTVKGRPSKEAATALYAKAALYNEDWSTALQKARTVLESGKYSLLADVFDIFDVNKEDAARQENIWAFEAERENPGNSSSLLSLYGPSQQRRACIRKINLWIYLCLSCFLSFFSIRGISAKRS